MYIEGANFELGNSLLSSVKFTKNLDPNKYYYYRYGIGFGGCGHFLLSDGSDSGKNVITFDAYMSSSVHIDNRKKEIFWFLGNLQQMV